MLLAAQDKEETFSSTVSSLNMNTEYSHIFRLFQRELGTQDTLGTQTKCKDDHAYMCTLLYDFTYSQRLEVFFHLVADVGMFCCVCSYKNNLYMKLFARCYCTKIIAVHIDICVQVVAAVGSLLGS